MHPRSDRHPGAPTGAPTSAHQVPRRPDHHGEEPATAGAALFDDQFRPSAAIRARIAYAVARVCTTRGRASCGARQARRARRSPLARRHPLRASAPRPERLDGRRDLMDRAGHADHNLIWGAHPGSVVHGTRAIVGVDGPREGAQQDDRLQYTAERPQRFDVQAGDRSHTDVRASAAGPGVGATALSS